MKLRVIPVLFCFACCFALGLGAGFIAGILRWPPDAYNDGYLEEPQAVTQLLEVKPAFAGVKMSVRLSGAICLTGRTPAGGAGDWLRTQLPRIARLRTVNAGSCT